MPAKVLPTVGGKQFPWLAICSCVCVWCGMRNYRLAWLTANALKTSQMSCQCLNVSTATTPSRRQSDAPPHPTPPNDTPSAAAGAGVGADAQRRAKRQRQRLECKIQLTCLSTHTYTHACICMTAAVRMCVCELSISCPIKQATRQQQQQQHWHRQRQQLQQLQMKLQRCLVKAMWIAQNPSHLSRCQLHFAYAICHTHATQSGRQSAVLKGAWQKGFISVPPPHASQSIEAAAVWLLANCFSRTLFNYYVSPPTHTYRRTQRHSLIKALLHIKLDYTVAVRLQLSDVACHDQMACQIRKHFVQMLPELRHTRAAPNRVWHFMMCPPPPALRNSL